MEDSPKRYSIPKIQFTQLKMVNKLKDPSEDASIPRGREKKARGEGETWEGMGLKP